MIKLRKMAKAVLAGVVPLAVYGAHRAGADLTVAQTAALTTFLAGLGVYFVPNKKP